MTDGMHWGTTEYTPLAHLFVGEGSACALCGSRQWDEPHKLVETHRDLADDELPAAVYAVEASDDNARGWASNGMRWSTQLAAHHWAVGLMLRWFGCTDIRVVRVTPPTRESGAYTVEEVLEDVLTH